MHNEEDPKWGRLAAAAISRIWESMFEKLADLNSRIYLTEHGAEMIDQSKPHQQTGWREKWDGEGREPVVFYTEHGWLSENEAWNKNVDFDLSVCGQV